MEPQVFLGIIVLIVILVYFLRTLKDIAQGIILIAIALIASGLIIGGTHEIGKIPIIGDYFSAQSMVEGVPGNIIETVESAAWNIEILEAQKDTEGNLIIIVQNRGQFALENFKLKVENRTTHIFNEPNRLEKGKTTALIADHKPEGLTKIELEAGQAKAEMIKEF